MKTMQEAKAKFAAKQLSREAQKAIVGGAQFQRCVNLGNTGGIACCKRSSNLNACCAVLIQSAAANTQACLGEPCATGATFGVGYDEGVFISSTAARCSRTPCNKTCGQYKWLV